MLGFIKELPSCHTNRTEPPEKAVGYCSEKFSDIPSWTDYRYRLSIYFGLPIFFRYTDNLYLLSLIFIDPPPPIIYFTNSAIHYDFCLKIILISRTNYAYHSISRNAGSGAASLSNLTARRMRRPPQLPISPNLRVMNNNIFKENGESGGDGRDSRESGSIGRNPSPSLSATSERAFAAAAAASTVAEAEVTTVRIRQVSTLCLDLPSEVKQTKVTEQVLYWILLCRLKALVAYLIISP
jgi:hypothetical protein